MNELEKSLHRTRKSLIQVCKELGILELDCEVPTMDNCSSCGIWRMVTELRPDLDKNPICKECFVFYGL